MRLNLAPEKWRLTAKVTALNALLVLIIVLITHFFENISLENYKLTHGQYFRPLTPLYLRKFFWEWVWDRGILEETLYRGPIWILSATGLIFCTKKYRLDQILIWTAILIPNYFWVRTHSHMMLMLPIFIAGASWGWLVVKTRSLWPAVLSHSASNFLIYLALKIALFFAKI